jgi:hypothetical protein
MAAMMPILPTATTVLRVSPFTGRSTRIRSDTWSRSSVSFGRPWRYHFGSPGVTSMARVAFVSSASFVTVGSGLTGSSPFISAPHGSGRPTPARIGVCSGSWDPALQAEPP